MILVDRTLDVLEAILRHEGGIGLADLAKITGLDINAVRRFTAALAKRGYVYQKHKGGNFSIGLRLLQFSYIANATASIKEQVLPFLNKFCDEISETVMMAILDGVEAVNVATIVPEHVLQAIPGNNIARYALHCTSIGKIFLACMPDERREHLISSVGLKVYTDHTITDVAHLRNEIKTIRRDGIAFDDEEYSIGVRSAAAPIKGDTGIVLAALCYIGPSVRITRARMTQLAPIVKSYALEISRSMGYKGE